MKDRSNRSSKKKKKKNNKQPTTTMTMTTSMTKTRHTVQKFTDSTVSFPVIHLRSNIWSNCFFRKTNASYPKSKCSKPIQCDKIAQVQSKRDIFPVQKTWLNVNQNAIIVHKCCPTGGHYTTCINPNNAISNKQITHNCHVFDSWVT